MDQTKTAVPTVPNGTVPNPNPAITAMDAAPEPSTPDTSRLIIATVDDTQVGIRLRPGEAITIGRGESSDVSLPGDDAMSRLHARLELREDGTVRLQDLGSANGIQVRVEGEMDLSPGMTATLGRTTLRLATTEVQ